MVGVNSTRCTSAIFYCRIIIRASHFAEGGNNGTFYFCANTSSRDGSWLLYYHLDPGVVDGLLRSDSFIHRERVIGWSSYGLAAWNCLGRACISRYAVDSLKRLSKGRPVLVILCFVIVDYLCCRRWNWAQKVARSL